MKALTALAAALLATACLGPHITTGAAPRSPAQTFDCMNSALRDLGFRIDKTEASTGFLKADKRDLGSPDSSEYVNVTISVYTNRDQETQYMITVGRTTGAPSGAVGAGEIFANDADGRVTDTLTARCGRK